jgi:hypothetical protein
MKESLEYIVSPFQMRFLIAFPFQSNRLTTASAKRTNRPASQSNEEEAFPGGATSKREVHFVRSDKCQSCRLLAVWNGLDKT